jgi:hypothetical protein
MRSGFDFGSKGRCQLAISTGGSACSWDTLRDGRAFLRSSANSRFSSLVNREEFERLASASSWASQFRRQDSEIDNSFAIVAIGLTPSEQGQQHAAGTPAGEERARTASYLAERARLRRGVRCQGPSSTRSVRGGRRDRLVGVAREQLLWNLTEFVHGSGSRGQGETPDDVESIVWPCGGNCSGVFGGDGCGDQGDVAVFPADQHRMSGFGEDGVCEGLYFVDGEPGSDGDGTAVAEGLDGLGGAAREGSSHSRVRRSAERRATV